MRPLAALGVALCCCASSLAVLPSEAHAQSSLTLRGNYWRDRNTRVLAPEAILRKELPTGTTVEASYMLDAITSASASAGVLADQPFTELRNEVGARLSQRIGPVTASANYRYSTESDYWAHTVGGGVMVDLLQKNLTLGASYNYSAAVAARRVSAVGYVWANGTRDESTLNSHFGILSFSQVLARWALVEGGYEFTLKRGFQANPYRTVKVAGSPVRETVPLERQLHSVVGVLRLTPLYHRGVLNYLTLLLKYRLFVDSWGLVAHTPELRAYLALGPVELRLTGRYMTQGGADFYRSSATTGNAEYAMPVEFEHCPAVAGAGGTKGQCATGDSKLSPFDSWFVEARLQLDLRVLDQPWMPGGSWLGRGSLGISGGRYINSGFAQVQFGDAWVGGVEVNVPL